MIYGAMNNVYGTASLQIASLMAATSEAKNNFACIRMLSGHLKLHQVTSQSVARGQPNIFNLNIRKSDEIMGVKYTQDGNVWETSMSGLSWL